MAGFAQPIDTRFGMDVGNTASYNANQMMLQKIAASMGLEELASQIKGREASSEYQRALSENLSREKTDPKKMAEAAGMILEQNNPRIAAALSNQEDTSFDNLLADPQLKQILGPVLSQLRPEQRRPALEAFYNAMPVNRQVASMRNAETGADARRNVGELNYHAATYRADKMAEVARIKASNPKAANVTTDKLYAQLVMDDPNLTKDQKLDQILTFKSAAAVAKPNTGIAPVVVTDESGKQRIKMANKPQPQAPTIKPKLTEEQLRKLKDL